MPAMMSAAVCLPVAIRSSSRPVSGTPSSVSIYQGQTDVALATPVSVVLGSDTADIDASIVRGATFSGTITDASNGAPLSNICVQPVRTGELSINSSVCTGPDGHFVTGGLVAGEYRLHFTNFSGRYVEQWYSNQPTKDTAQPLSGVLGNDLPGLDVAMQLGGTITGTVTKADGAPATNVCVTLYKPADGTFAGSGGCTDGQGVYESAAVLAGSYSVGFHDSTGLLHDEYYNDKTVLAGATSYR